MRGAHFPYLPIDSCITNVDVVYMVSEELFSEYKDLFGQKGKHIEFMNLVDVLIKDQLIILSPSNHMVKTGEKFIYTNSAYMVREKNNKRYPIYSYKERL